MKRRAEVNFVERSFAGRGLPGWNVYLVNRDQVLDQQDHDEPVGTRGFYARIDYVRPYGGIDGYGEDTPEGERARYAYVTQGRHPSGRRYGVARTLDAAQRAVMAWARRRFYYSD